MYATVVHADIHDVAAARQGLAEPVLPGLKQAPGLVGAYFVQLDDAHGVSVVVFEIEEQARAGAPPAGTEAPGATVAQLQIGEVIGSV